MSKKSCVQESRVEDAGWLRDQIRILAEDAAGNAKEDMANAKNGDSDDRDRYVAMSECAAYYEKQLRYILTGTTFDEELERLLRRASKKK